MNWTDDDLTARRSGPRDADRAPSQSTIAWTDDRVEALKKLWKEGFSASQIARQLQGVTRNAVIGKVHRIGLAGRATTVRDKPETNGRKRVLRPMHVFKHGRGLETV